MNEVFMKNSKGELISQAGDGTITLLRSIKLVQPSFNQVKYVAKQTGFDPITAEQLLNRGEILEAIPKKVPIF